MLNLKTRTMSKEKTYYINRKFEYRNEFTGEKEFESDSYAIQGKEAASEEVREARWKYSKEKWDGYRNEYYQYCTVWMSSRATKSYYKSLQTQ